MGLPRRMIRALCGLALAMTAGPVVADELHVMASSGFAAAFRRIAPEFERTTAHEVVVSYGPSTGPGSDALSGRLAGAETADVVIMARPAIDALVAAGKADGASRVDLARTGVGVVVKAGASHPDIGTVAGLKAALLDARTIAVSDGLSGTYIVDLLLPQLGIAEAVASKLRRISGQPVARAVARGEAEIGFQAASEMLTTPDVDYLGPLPREVQHTTVLTAALTTGARDREVAQALMAFLAAPPAIPVMMKAGLEPMAGGNALVAH